MTDRYNGRAWQPGEGNPYGTPGRGNFDLAWRRAARCRSHQSHSLRVEGNRITVVHR